MSQEKVTQVKRKRTFDRARAVDAVADLIATYGAEDLALMLQYLQKFRINGHGVEVPAELSLGIGMQSSGAYGILRPHQGRGPAKAVQLFTSPRDYASLIFGNDDTFVKPTTWAASFLITAVAAQTIRFHERLTNIATITPSSRLGRLKADFFQPLSNHVEPRAGRDDPFLRRQLVLTVPFAATIRQVAGDLTALFAEDPMTPAQLARLIHAVWHGEPPLGELENDTPESLALRMAPSGPDTTNNRMSGSNESFAFAYIEPIYDEKSESLLKLLSLLIDYNLAVKFVGDQPVAQLLARIRDNRPGRVNVLMRRLRECCNVVRPIEGDDMVLRANWAFQPGSEFHEELGVMSLIQPRWLINGLTRTISRASVDGEIFCGIEPNGSRYFLSLGEPSKGGFQHVEFNGQGSAGKTYLMNLVAHQIAGIYQLGFTFNEDEREAYPRQCWLWGPQTQNHTVDEYSDPKTGHLHEGLHYIRTDGTPDKPGVREWIGYFRTQEGETLEQAYFARVVPAARAFLEGIDLSRDFPFSLRPAEGCNISLFAALVSTIWRGQDPSGNDLPFKGFKTRWSEWGTRDHHLALRTDDVYRLPSYNELDPNDYGGKFAESVRNGVIFDATGGAHKKGVHVLIGLQSEDDWLKFHERGTRGHFHRRFDIVALQDDVSGQLIRMLKIIDGKTGEVLATVNPTFEQGTPLERFLSRAK